MKHLKNALNKKANAIDLHIFLHHQGPDAEIPPIKSDEIDAYHDSKMEEQNAAQEQEDAAISGMVDKYKKDSGLAPEVKDKIKDPDAAMESTEPNNSPMEEHKEMMDELENLAPKRPAGKPSLNSRALEMLKKGKK